MDAPKTLSCELERASRKELLSKPHVAHLVSLVARMRDAKGPSYIIPDFDPMDGGSNAKILFLLEAPGPKAVGSGFVSRNNPDETAKNFYLLNDEAGIDRRLAIIWNAVPWYIGTGSKIRPAKFDDVREADEWLKALLVTLQQLRIVVFVGQKALYAKKIVSKCRPDVELMTMHHPSPMFINRAPINRARALAALHEISAHITNSSP